MSHEVKINDAEILTAFEAIEAGGAALPPIPAEPGQPPAPSIDGWLPATRLAASILAHKVCPAWNVPMDTQTQWAEALAECAEQLMPGGLGNIEAWGPWGKLAFASSLWLLAGLDMETMTLKPRHVVIEGEQQDQARAPQGGGFKTDA